MNLREKIILTLGYCSILFVSAIRDAQSSQNMILWYRRCSRSLLQSHVGEISLLPALPPSWSTGSVTGLRARGGFEVGMQWKDGKLQFAIIQNSAPARFKVRYGTKTTEVSIKAGQTLLLNADLMEVN
jgi:hypothetical protein